jgi:hypothetical protein
MNDHLNYPAQFFTLFTAALGGLCVTVDSPKTEAEHKNLVYEAYKIALKGCKVLAMGDCTQCIHYEFDTGDESVGMDPQGHFCLLDENGYLTQQIPEVGQLCPHHRHKDFPHL